MKIVFGADHGGYELKNYIKENLNNDIEILDVGTNSSESVDYPDFAKLASEKFFESKADYMFLFCGSGIGISISANKIKGIRAALVHNEELAKLAKMHNNANCLCMGGRFIEKEKGLSIAKAFLKSNFEGDRHIRRIKKISKLEDD